MATSYNIDDIKRLFNDRAGTRGVSSNVGPEKFNRFWNSGELKFFNTRYDYYAKNEAISDSISKWLTNPLYIPIGTNGMFPFFTGMSLLHVDSMSAYLNSTTTTGSVGSITLTPGSGYTNNNYSVTLTGGTGTGATANVIVAGGAVTSIVFTSLGTGFTINDNLTAAIAGGTGWKVVVNSIIDTTEYEVTRVEKQRWAANISSTYDAPNQQFPIYTQYSNSFLFAPANLGMAKIVYLQQPVWSKWGYTLNGYIATLTGLVGGTSYTTGTYTNVPLTGGAGNGALATITVAAGAVTNVQITNPGKIYMVNDVLSALAANIGGTGSGFSITVSSLVSGSIRPIYDSTNSIQPLWNNDDISTIIDLALADAAVSARDKELTNFADNAAKSQQ